MFLDLPLRSTYKKSQAKLEFLLSSVKTRGKMEVGDQKSSEKTIDNKFEVL
jgi:hypothetical protein